jgi:hypothetical protein
VVIVTPRDDGSDIDVHAWVDRLRARERYPVVAFITGFPPEHIRALSEVDWLDLLGDPRNGSTTSACTTPTGSPAFLPRRLTLAGSLVSDDGDTAASSICAPQLPWPAGITCFPVSSLRPFHSIRRRQPIGVDGRVDCRLRVTLPLWIGEAHCAEYAGLDPDAISIDVEGRETCNVTQVPTVDGVPTEGNGFYYGPSDDTASWGIHTGRIEQVAGSDFELTCTDATPGCYGLSTPDAGQPDAR